MSNKSGNKETLVLTLSLLVTMGVLAGGAFFMRDSIGNLLGGESVSVDRGETGSSSRGRSGGSGDLGDRISSGERNLVSDTTSTAKAAGIQAYANGDYSQAVSAFEASLQENRNDPEALIYLNNARIGTQTAHTIAVAAPLSTALDPGKEMLRGAAQAQDQINQAGGIAGVPLKILLVDDGDDPQITESLAETLGNQAEVLAVVGHFSSNVTIAAEPIYTQAQMPFISTTSTALELSGRSPFFFRTTPSDRFTAAALSRHMLNDLGETNVAVFYNADSTYSLSLKNEFTTATFSDGGAVVEEFNVVDSGFNASQAVNQAIDRGAEVIMLAANTGTLDQALAVIAANQGRLTLLGGDSLYNPRILQQGQANADGMRVAIPWHILAHDDASFSQTARSLWGGDVNWRTATTYDAIASLITALESLPNPSRQALQTALRDPSFQADGSTDLVRFLPSGDRNQAAQLVQIVPGNRSGYGYDYEPLD